MTRKDNEPCPGWNYREMAAFTFSRKVFFWPKMHFNPKNTQNFLMFILEKGTFFFEQLFPVVARTWLILRSELFFGDPKSWFLAEKKLIFCYTTPILVNGPFLALEETVHNPRWERFFDFSFPSYGRFRKKKPGRRVKKCPPSPLWGQRLPVTARAGLILERKVIFCTRDVCWKQVRRNNSCRASVSAGGMAIALSCSASDLSGNSYASNVYNHIFV